MKNELSTKNFLWETKKNFPHTVGNFWGNWRFSRFSHVLSRFFTDHKIYDFMLKNITIFLIKVFVN